VGRAAEGEEAIGWTRPGFWTGIYTFLVYSMPTAVLLTFGGIFARDAFHALCWLITLIFAAFFTTSFLARIFLLAGLALVSLSGSLLAYMIAFSVLGVPHGLARRWP
jgi:hypothetical protein